MKPGFSAVLMWIPSFETSELRKLEVEVHTIWLIPHQSSLAYLQALTG